MTASVHPDIPAGRAPANTLAGGLLVPAVRNRLFTKYDALLVAVVGVTLLSGGIFEVFTHYREHRASLIRIQHEQAAASGAFPQGPGCPRSPRGPGCPRSPRGPGCPRGHGPKLTGTAMGASSVSGSPVTEARTAWELASAGRAGAIRGSSRGSSTATTAFTAELQAAVEGVKAGKEPDLLSGQLARDALVLCHKECESVRSGKPVVVA